MVQGRRPGLDVLWPTGAHPRLALLKALIQSPSARIGANQVLAAVGTLEWSRRSRRR